MNDSNLKDLMIQFFRHFSKSVQRLREFVMSREARRGVVLAVISILMLSDQGSGFTVSGFRVKKEGARIVGKII